MDKLYFFILEVIKPFYNSVKLAELIRFIMINYDGGMMKEEELRDAIVRFYSEQSIYNVKRVLLDLNIMMYYFDEEGRKYKITKHFWNKMKKKLENSDDNSFKMKIRKLMEVGKYGME